jgi:hypothetical protein
MTKLQQFSNNLIFPICCLIISSSHAQDILWEKSYGGKHADYLFDAIPTADYGFVLAGSSLSEKTGNKKQAGKGSLDYWIWKMDENGNEDWQKSFGGSGVDMLQSIGRTSDGGFILAGTSSSPMDGDKTADARGESDFWIIKLNAGGGEMWQKTIGGNGQDELLMVKQTKDGGYILGGTSASGKSAEKAEDSRGNSDYWIVKLDKSGTIEWQKTYGGNYVDELRGIEQTTDGGYIVGGYSNSLSTGDKLDGNYGAGDFWILKLSDSGDITWQKTLGGDKDDQLYAIHQTRDGGFILGGNSNSGSSNNKTSSSKKGTDFWVVKLDEFGNNKWQESYNYGDADVLTSIVENDDGTFLISGYSQGGGSGRSSGIKVSAPKGQKGINDYIALKINAIGEEKWTKTVGSGGEDILRRAIETRDGGYLLSGTSKGKASGDKNSGNGGNDFWVVKLLDREKPKEVARKIEAIPNPAMSYTNVIVGYEFIKGTATVYDLAGRQLQSFDVDSRTVPVNLSGLPEGIYLVQIATEVSTDAVKVIKGKAND